MIPRAHLKKHINNIILWILLEVLSKDFVLRVQECQATVLFFFSPVAVVTLGDITELVCGSGREEVGILLKITPQKTNMTMENHHSK